MMVVAFDTETALIRPACLAPAMVCLTYQVHHIPNAPGVPQILHHSDAHWVLRAWFTRPDVVFVGQNVAYDMAVLIERYPWLRPHIFRAYRENRVTDTMIRAQLLDIAAGRYPKGAKAKNAFTLETLAKQYAGIELQKDAWRLSYAEFLDTPLERWEERAVEVQAAARARIPELEDAIASEQNKARKKELQDQLTGIIEMVASHPSQCKIYPLEDARATLAVNQAQEQHARYLEDQYRQARAYFALHLSSAWGLRTDPAGVEILRKEIEAQLEECREELIEAGLVRENGVKDTKAAAERMKQVCRERGIPIPRTDKHNPKKTPPAKLCTLWDKGDECPDHVCLDGEACEESEDEILMRYGEYTTLGKVLSNDIKALRAGVMYPIHTRYGLAETGRTTSSRPNIQNWARGRKCKTCSATGTVGDHKCRDCGGSGSRAGAREAFIPRPGYVFAQADFPQLELHTWAQCCRSWFGFSRLAEAINAGLDAHLMVAAIIVGISYDEAKLALKDKSHPKHSQIKKTRGAAKPANFGLPGGIGLDSYVDYAWKGYGVRVTHEQAKEIRDVWRKAWPESNPHFARVNSLIDEDTKKAVVETLFTKRTRGGASYCAACNNGFQALGADCAKNAAWLITEAMYDNPESPLFNCRMVAFIHDEFILEVPDDERAHDAAVELARLMTVGANAYLPDVPIPMSKMEPQLMRIWSKKAEPVKGSDGRLIPWEPEQRAA